MKTMLLKRARATALASMSLLWIAGANAAAPASIAGTWSAVGNQTLGKLEISQAASAATCKPIRGSIFSSTTTIEGFYCPVTGRIAFARRTAGGVPFQLYEGHVSRDGAVDRMGGSLIIWNGAGGGLGNEGVDFNFSATK